MIVCNIYTSCSNSDTSRACNC